jgi:LysR family transcriptional regulator, low CO2-responsive transcriptional regulator
MPRRALRRYFRHGLLPQLFVFHAVARVGNVTRAAAELHLAQPTVSVQLKKLAQALELRLFEPRGRELQLTPAGCALRAVCEELIECLSRAEERLAPWRSPKCERLLLAAEPEAREIASRLLGRFCARHPGIEASLHIAEREELLARLHAGLDDVVVFGLEVEGLAPERRWSIAHAKGRELAELAAEFLREALAGFNGNGRETPRQPPGATLKDANRRALDPK